MFNLVKIQELFIIYMKNWINKITNFEKIFNFKEIEIFIHYFKIIVLNSNSHILVNFSIEIIDKFLQKLTIFYDREYVSND